MDRYQEYRPSPDLASHVACTWTRIVGARTENERDPIIPDGCVDVIAYGDAPPHVAGPATETQWVALPPGSVITGIRFCPAAARDILHCSMEDLRNAEADLAAVCDGRGVALRHDLDAASTPHDKRDVLERWTRDQLRAGRGRDAAVVTAARLLARAGSTVDDAAVQLGWSVRRLHRQFVAACGYGPKLLQRVLRLQRALRLAHGPERVTDDASHRAGGLATPGSLTALAAAAGYADQAHMTREFRALTGFTPRDYLSAANPCAGQWLDSDTSGVEG